LRRDREGKGDLTEGLEIHRRGGEAIKDEVRYSGAKETTREGEDDGFKKHRDNDRHATESQSA
jgi:hypothetical protein